MRATACSLLSERARVCVLCVCVCVYYVSLEVERLSLFLSLNALFSIDENCMKCLFSLLCECFMRVSPPSTRV